MKLSLFYILVFLQVVMGATVSVSTSSTSTTSSKSSTEPTLVWVTGTTKGIVTVTQSPYTQKFAKMFSATDDAKSGGIGLGTLSGTVGDIRTYTQVTVSEGGAFSLTPGLTSLHRQSGISGLTSLLLSMFTVSGLYLILI